MPHNGVLITTHLGPLAAPFCIRILLLLLLAHTCKVTREQHSARDSDAGHMMAGKTVKAYSCCTIFAVPN